jgi:hypothetical protein
MPIFMHIVLQTKKQHHFEHKIRAYESNDMLFIACLVWENEKVAKGGKRWQKVAKGGKRWQKVAKGGKRWQKVAKGGKTESTQKHIRYIYLNLV